MFKICSVFGQCDRVAAQMLIDAGKLRKIEFDAIPAEYQFNSEGTRASFAVIVPTKAIDREFEELTRELRL